MQVDFGSLVEEMALLPKSLIEIGLPTAAYKELNVLELLPNLEQPLIARPYPECYLDNLPPKLRVFHNAGSGSRSLAGFPSLPSGLTTLGIRTDANAEDLKKLPHSLRSLYLTVLSGTLSLPAFQTSYRPD
jgi:hypothetical protein